MAWGDLGVFVNRDFSALFRLFFRRERERKKKRKKEREGREGKGERGREREREREWEKDSFVSSLVVEQAAFGKVC